MFTEAIIIRERCNYCIQSLSEVTKPLHRTRRPFPFILYSNSIQFHFRLEKMELQQIEREREEWKKIAQTNKPNEKLVAHDAEYGIVLIITIIIIILKGSFSLFNIYLSCIVLSHEKNGFGSGIFLRCRFYWLHRIKNEQQQRSNVLFFSPFRSMYRYILSIPFNIDI